MAQTKQKTVDTLDIEGTTNDIKSAIEWSSIMIKNTFIVDTPNNEIKTNGINLP